MLRALARAGAVLAAAGVLGLAGAGIASAHVAAHSPDQLTRGGDGEIVFRVPNEDDTAGTVKLQVTFSTTSPLSNAVLKPTPGWTGTVTMATLAKPVNMGNQQVTTAVSAITWTAQPGTRINPGEFQEFTFATEGLPTNTDTLVLPAVQTYDSGRVVRWDQPTVAGKPEPDHPAPSLALGAVDSAAATPAASDGTARWLGGLGLAFGTLALGLGLGAFFRGRRGPAAPVDPVAIPAAPVEPAATSAEPASAEGVDQGASA